MDYNFDYADWGLEMALQTEAYDYEWDIFTIFKESDTGYYYWIAESGCSCNSPLEDVRSKSDFTRGSKQELMLAFSEWINDGSIHSLRPQGADRTEYLADLARI
jgi:hypothetical protein